MEYSETTIAPSEVGLWIAALSRSELFLNKILACETDKNSLRQVILRNLLEKGSSDWDKVVMVIAQEMKLELNQSLRENLNEHRRSAVEGSSAMSHQQQSSLHWTFRSVDNLSEWPTVASVPEGLAIESGVPITVLLINLVFFQKQPAWSMPFSLLAAKADGCASSVNSASPAFFIFVFVFSYLVVDNTLCVQLLRATGFMLAYFVTALRTYSLAHFVACQRVRLAWQNWLHFFLTEEELGTFEVSMEGRPPTSLLLFLFHHFMLLLLGETVPMLLSAMTLVSLIMISFVAIQLPCRWRPYILVEAVLAYLLAHINIADVLVVKHHVLPWFATGFAVLIVLCSALLDEVFSFSSLRQSSVLSATLWHAWLFTLLAQLEQTAGRGLQFLLYFPSFAVLVFCLLWIASLISLKFIAKVFLSIAAVLFAVRSIGGSTTTVEVDELSELSWSAFESQCGSSLLSLDNRIAAQEKCSTLKGTIIQWKGTVHTVQMYSPPRNSGNSMLSSWLSDLLCGNDECSQEDKLMYEIEISGPWGEHVISSAKGTAHLMAAGSFRPALIYLREGDVIQFRAFFIDSLMRYPPRLSLLGMKCISCSKELHDSLGNSIFPERREVKRRHIFSSLASLLLLLGLAVP